MSEATGQDKTEEPTARKLSKAREDGQVARSTELPAAVIVIGMNLLADAAVMALVVFLIPDPASGVAEMARVLRPGEGVHLEMKRRFGA